MYTESSVEGDVIMTKGAQGSEPLGSSWTISGALLVVQLCLALGRICRQLCSITKQIFHVLFTQVGGTELNLGFLLHFSVVPHPPLLGLGFLAVKIRRWHLVAFYFSSTISRVCSSALNWQTKAGFFLEAREWKLQPSETLAEGFETSLFQGSYSV